jgi:hypothetical protein
VVSEKIIYSSDVNLRVCSTLIVGSDSNNCKGFQIHRFATKLQTIFSAVLIRTEASCISEIFIKRDIFFIIF